MHLELGWVWCFDPDCEDRYFYDPRIGPFYTRPDLYPHLYSYAEGSWLYWLSVGAGRCAITGTTVGAMTGYLSFLSAPRVP